MGLGENVKMRRIRLGLSQEELATKMGYKSRSSINKIEKGRNCSQKVIADLAKALGCSPAELLFETKGGLDQLFDELSDSMKGMEEIDMFRYALENCGRFNGVKWTDKEIMKLIRYAGLILEDRE